MEWHLKRGEELLGVLLKSYRFSLGELRILNLPHLLRDVQPLFDEELTLLDADLMDAWQNTYDCINALGLQLVDSKDGKDIGEFLLHIR